MLGKAGVCGVFLEIPGEVPSARAVVRQKKELD